MGVIPASPLAMGLLTPKGPPDWHPAPEELKTACRRAAELCASRGADISRLALQFAVANEELDTVLVGTANPENLRKNVAWIEEPLDQELLAEVREILAPVDGITWPEGRPEKR